MKKSILSLISLLLILLHDALSASASVSPPSHAVIVVGAGMSGIMAAKTLKEGGIEDVVILEATSRIGGRMKKSEIGGYTVELGANWIQSGGPVSNPIAGIAKKLNLKSSLTDLSNLSSNTYQQEGGLYGKEMVEEAERFAVARDDFCVNLSRFLSSQPGKDDDVSISAGYHLFGKIPETALDRLVDYVHNDYDTAEPPEMTSLKNSFPRWENADHGEQSYFVADSRGFEGVVQYLTDQFLSSDLTNDSRLHFNKVVRKITYDDTSVQVTTEDGSIYRAKYVIVSASLGVLQSNLIQFSPLLPTWKRIAIDDFSMTLYTKIFLKFPCTFWPTTTQLFLYAHIERGYYPIWQNLDGEYPGSNILFVLVSHDESRRIDQLKDKDVAAEMMNVLRKMFGKDIPEPESILVPRWSSDRFYKGCYSNWPRGYTRGRHRQLGANVGRVYFTGEHTHNKYYGWVTGAYFAGIATAEDLMKNTITSA